MFKAAGAKFVDVKDPTAIDPQYECITPMRVLLARERNKDRWEKEVEIMESHTEERKLTDLWQVRPSINDLSFELKGLIFFPDRQNKST